MWPFAKPDLRPLTPAEKKQARQMLKEGHDGAYIARLMKVHPETLYAFIGLEEDAAAKREEERRKKDPFDGLRERLDDLLQSKISVKAQTDPQWLNSIADARLEALLAQNGLAGKPIPGEGMGAVALERGLKLAERLLATPQGQGIALTLLQRLTPPEEKDRMIAELLGQIQAMQGQQPQSQITEEQPAERPQLRLVTTEEEPQPMNLADLSLNEAISRWLGLDPELAAAECLLYATAHPEKGDLTGLLAMSADQFMASDVGREIDPSLLMQLATEQGQAWLTAFRAALTQTDEVGSSAM